MSSSSGFFIPPTIAAIGCTDLPPMAAHNFCPKSIILSAIAPTSGILLIT
ncbi:MAG: hypothetical protein ACP6IY_05180 [Promethearchaeia archaeon]